MKRLRRKLTFLLLVFTSIQFPDQPVFPGEFRLAIPERETTQDADWREKAEKTSPFLSPHSVFYALALLVVVVLSMITAIDVILKTVFIVCTVGVYWATYSYSLQSLRPSMAPNSQSATERYITILYELSCVFNSLGLPV